MTYLNINPATHAVGIRRAGIQSGRGHCLIELCPPGTSAESIAIGDLVRNTKSLLHSVGRLRMVTISCAPYPSPPELGLLVQALCHQALMPLVELRADDWRPDMRQYLTLPGMTVECLPEGCRRVIAEVGQLADSVRYICRARHNCVRDGLPAMNACGEPLRVPRPSKFATPPEHIYLQPHDPGETAGFVANRGIAREVCLRHGYRLTGSERARVRPAATDLASR